MSLEIFEDTLKAAGRTEEDILRISENLTEGFKAKLVILDSPEAIESLLTDIEKLGTSSEDWGRGFTIAGNDSLVKEVKSSIGAQKEAFGISGAIEESALTLEGTSEGKQF